MSKDTFWFSHDYHSRADKKLIRLRMKHNMIGVGVYWCIVEMLYEEGGYLQHSEYERIAFELQTNEDIIKSVVNDFNLFEVDLERFWSNSALERLKLRKDKSNKARESISYRWNNTNEERTNNDTNTINERKGKEIKEKEIKRGISFSKNGEEVIFEDKTKQKLGKDQKALFDMGQLKPKDVTKGLIN
jgi:Domain of unknown function (DUF4373)